MTEAQTQFTLGSSMAAFEHEPRTKEYILVSGAKLVKIGVKMSLIALICTG